MEGLGEDENKSELAVLLEIALTEATALAGTATIELCGRTVFVPTQHRPSVRAFLQRVVDLGASAPSMQ